MADHNQRYKTAIRHIKDENYQPAYDILANILNGDEGASPPLAKKFYKPVLTLFIHSCNNLKYYQQAIDMYEKYDRLHKQEIQDAAIYANIAISYRFIGDYDRALALYHLAAQHNENDHTIYYNAAITMLEMHDYDGAIQFLQQSIAIKNDYLNAMILLARIHRNICQFDKSIALYKKIISLNPDDFESRISLSSIYFLTGRYQQAYELFAWRFKHSAFKRREMAVPRQLQELSYDENKLAHAHQGPAPYGGILIWGEQGIGDEIMFMSQLMKISKNIRPIMIFCSGKLATIFKRSFPDYHIIDNLDVMDEKFIRQHNIRFHIPMGKIMALDNKYICHDGQAFLKSDFTITRKIKSFLQSEAGDRLTVGITWHTFARDAEMRCIPPELLINNIDRILTNSPLANNKAPYIINLQYGGPHYPTMQNDLKAAVQKSNLEIHAVDNIDNWENIDNFASLVASLDIIIGIGASAIHVAGALGVKGIVLLPYSPSWRWQLQQGPSLWYKSVYTIRQKSPGNWQSALQEIPTALKYFFPEKWE